MVGFFFPNKREDLGLAASYLQEGLRFERRGDYENAILSYQKEIEINPSNAAAYNALAWLYVDKLEIKYDEAIVLAETAVMFTEDRDHPARDFWLANYLDTLGWAHYKNANYEEAVIHLERAVALDNRRSYLDHLQSVRNALNYPIETK